MSWFLLQTPILQTMQLQSMAQTSIERILNALPEGCLIALFAWILLRVLGKQNSGTRFAVWFLALLAVAALPVLGGFGAGQALIASSAAMAHSISSSLSLEGMRPAITLSGRWALLVFFLWAVGASVAVARLAAGLWHVRKLRHSCTPIVAADLDPAVRKTVDAILASSSSTLGGSQSVTVATSEKVCVPAALGFWKRTIVLPAWALQELPPEDLNVILLHEFAHLRRADDWTNLIQKIVRALFFFHPAVWWIENRLSVEREMACDDAVLAQTSNPHGYATCLVSLLEKSLAHRLSPSRWSMAQAAVQRAREASLRLSQILDTNRPTATRIWKPALGIVAVFSMFCFAVVPVAPQLVAFDRGGNKHAVVAGNSAFVYPAVARQSSTQASLPAPVVIPAALRLAEPSSPATTARIRHSRVPANRVARNENENEKAPSRLAAAGLSVALRQQARAVAASAEQGIVPQVRTLVFFETEYTASGSTVWSVQVWHVMLFTRSRVRSAKVPVVNAL